jgi:hypothetical protein
LNEHRMAWVSAGFAGLGIASGAQVDGEHVLANTVSARNQRACLLNYPITLGAQGLDCPASESPRIAVFLSAHRQKVPRELADRQVRRIVGRERAQDVVGRVLPEVDHNRWPSAARDRLRQTGVARCEVGIGAVKVFDRVTEVLGANAALPWHPAVTGCDPTRTAVVVKAAFPALSVAEPSIVVASWNTTDPVGVPLPATVLPTVAVNMTDWPSTELLALELRVVVLATP